MRNGDMIFLWTDGLSDALNSAGERYGEQRLEQLVSGLSTESARDSVLAATGLVTEFAADTPQFDDLQHSHSSIIPTLWTGRIDKDFANPHAVDGQLRFQSCYSSVIRVATTPFE